MENILTYKVQLTNEFDAEKCHDGGSYPDYTAWAIFEGDKQITVFDSSCGDFGGSFRATLSDGKGNVVKSANWGSLEGDNIWSEFEEEDSEMLRLFQEATGYHIPQKDETRYAKAIIWASGWGCDEAEFLDDPTWN